MTNIFSSIWAMIYAWICSTFMIACPGPSAPGAMRYITLPNHVGVMPIVGYGTWQAFDEQLERGLDLALESGYRHIDTAAAYENEHTIGKVLDKWFKSGRIKREDLFITSKLPQAGNRASNVEKFLKLSLEKLKIDYLDLYLVHGPWGYIEGPSLHPTDENGVFQLDNTTNHIAVWKAMEDQVTAGRTKAIGLANFNKRQISRVLEAATIPPANLQVELQIYFQQRELHAFCKEHNIRMTAYSPLGSRAMVERFNLTRANPNPLEDPTVVKIARRHSKTPAHILLKHTINKGVAVIPKSVTPSHLTENIKLFDFHLSAHETAELDRLNKEPKGRIWDLLFMKGLKDHPEYPF